MTRLSNSTCVTDLDDTVMNAMLTAHGHTIRHVETWHRGGEPTSYIVWDAPEIAEVDLPF